MSQLVVAEEVLNNVRALWWSPDGKRIAFMRFNDTKVMDYPLQVCGGFVKASVRYH